MKLLRKHCTSYQVPNLPTSGNIAAKTKFASHAGSKNISHFCYGNMSILLACFQMFPARETEFVD